MSFQQASGHIVNVYFKKKHTQKIAFFCLQVVYYGCQLISWTPILLKFFKGSQIISQSTQNTTNLASNASHANMFTLTYLKCINKDI